jgi:hypothetical protein
MVFADNKSHHFRYVYANGFGFQGGPNEMTLTFGFKGNPLESDDSTIQEVGVIMLPSLVKLIAKTLTEIVAHIEKTNNSEIPFDASKMEELKKVLELSTAATSSPLPS